MTIRHGRFLLAALLLFSISCGSSSPAPAPTPTTTGIAVNSSGSQVFLGASEVFTATATLSNGTNTAVSSGTWSSDAPNVAPVDGTGRVSGSASGSANISVDYQGKRGTKAIRVVPNYQGGWVGAYTVGSCTDTLQFLTTSFCNTVFPVSSVLPFGFAFSQTGTTLSGSTHLGGIASNFATAPVQNDGSVQLPAVAIFGTTTFTETWNFNMPQPGRIAGTLHLVVTDSVVTGSSTMDATLSNTTPQSLARTLGIKGVRAPDAAFSVRALLELLGRSLD